MDSRTWTTPTIRTLNVNLDTAIGQGSTADQDGSSYPSR